MPDPITPEVVEEPTQLPDATEEPEYITLDPRKLPEEIRRLQQERSDFKQAFNTEVGNAAQKQTKRQYEPEIKTLRQQLEDERLLRRRAEILNMPEKDIEREFAASPDFAKEYAEVVHYKPKDAVDDPTPIITAAWEEAEQYARDNGVSEDFINQVAVKAQQGGYLKENEHWSIGLNRIQQDLSNEVVRVKTTSAPPTVNPNITKDGAVISPAGRGKAQGFDFKTVAEFKAKPRSVQESILDQPGGMDYVTELMKKG